MVVLAHRLSPSIPPIEEESVAVDNSSGRLPLTYPPVGHMLVFIAPLLLFFGPEDEEHPLASLWLGGNGCFNTLFGFVQCSVPRVSQGSQSRQLSISGEFIFAVFFYTYSVNSRLGWLEPPPPPELVPTKLY